MKYLLLVVFILLGPLSCTDESTSAEANPTWFADIQPVMQTYCTRCHSPTGSGPGDFSSLEEVEIKAEVMLNYIEDGDMPPGASDPKCRDYIGSEHMVVADKDLELFKKWIETGKTHGDPNTAVTVQVSPLTIENPDLEIRIRTPYAPTFSDPNNIGNEYRCFALDHQQTEPFYITALHPIVDQPKMVHHIVLFKTSETLPNSYHSDTGADCINSIPNNQIDGMVAGWAPGASPIVFAEGYGLRVNPNETIFIQMHYFENGPEVAGLADQTGYAFKTSQENLKPILMIPFGENGFSIPAGDDAYSYTSTQAWDNFPPVTLHGIFAHMHILGSGYKFWIERDGQENCLVESEKFNFENQQTYMLNEPFQITSGDDVSFRCTWNNSNSNPKLIHSPPITTYYGERTDEEMCFAFILGSIGS